MSEAKRAGLIEAGWQELLDLGLRGPPERLARLRAVFMAGAIHAVGLIVEILADVPDGSEVTEAQAVTLNGILDECRELASRGSRGDFAP